MAYATAKMATGLARIGQPSLRTRISLLLTAVSACLTLALGALWLQATRASIDEEITAGTRVCEQWLTVLSGELNAGPDAAASARLLERLRAAGRIRSNALSASDAAGHTLYVSPASRYKTGRNAPPWFAALLDPRVPPRHLAAGPLTLVLTPDASRATVDAWDSALTMTLWAGALLALLFLATRRLLDRTLAPLDQIRNALECTGRGHFDRRLPVYATQELNLLAHAYNGMADRLNEAVNDNVRLYGERDLAQLMHTRLADAARVRVALRLCRQLDGDWLELTLADNGRGLPPAAGRPDGFGLRHSGLPWPSRRSAVGVCGMAQALSRSVRSGTSGPGTNYRAPRAAAIPESREPGLAIVRGRA